MKSSMATAALRKYSRLRRPGGLRREYKKLRSLLPGATRSRHLRKKVGVVEAAYQYICELQAALLDKFSTKGVPEDLAGIVRGKVATASDIQALALHLINNSPSMNNNNNNNNNNYNNFIRSNYANTAAPTHLSFLPRPTQQSDLRLPQINNNNNNNNKPETEAPSVPKTTTSPSQANTTMNSTVCSSPAPTATLNTVLGLPQGCIPSDNSSHVPTDSNTHHHVDGEVPLLSKNISDISLSVREESTAPFFSTGSSSSSALLLSSHPSPTIEK
ncbi:GATA zinc finger domain-containing protein 14-like isoform X2 [Macrobrachium nipponense]|uniref:GATA zinc finger domain-containing protein 14-like isoform X2 n=1 Tax=Macrobrachium nipponense TaxID=159736 RepID=UPI0030C7F7AA